MNILAFSCGTGECEPMNRLVLYKVLTFVWLTAFVVGIYFLAADNAFSARTAACLGAIILALIAQALVLRCVHCGARPGLWVLAIWTLFVDYELYFADTLLLRRCPRCGKGLINTSFQSNTK